MNHFEPEFLTYISRRYSTYTNTRTLWEAAGGDIAEIEDQGAAMDRWAHLLRLAESGAIRPLDLTLAALQRDPHNSVLLADLQRQVPVALQLHAERVVDEGLQEAKPQSERILTDLGDLNQPEVMAATVLAAEKAEKEKSGGAGALMDILKEGAKTATSGAVRLGLAVFARHLGVSSDGDGS